MPDTFEPPRRFRLSRAKGSRLPEGAVSVARPTRWGNPWKAEVVDGVGWCCTDTRTGLITQARDRADAHAMAVSHFATWANGNAAFREAARATLRGKCLACWCPHDVRCHADALLEMVNG
jgi:hypothetical protein